MATMVKWARRLFIDEYGDYWMDEPSGVDRCFGLSVRPVLSID